MKTIQRVFWLFVIAAAIFGSALGQATETDIDLADVPMAVLKAATEAVPQLKVEEAEREDKDGSVFYELEGRANGKSYEVRLSADGQVLEVEEETD